MSDFQEEALEYSRALEKVLKQFTGLDLRLMEEDLLESGDKIDLNIGLYKPESFPPFVDDVFHKIADSVLDILPNEIDSKESLDWKALSDIEDTLSMKFIFNSSNEKSKFKNKDFINSLVNIGKKTYEGSSTDIGIIYAEKEKFHKLKDIYKFEIIEIKEQTNLENLFQAEKPLLKVIDGKSINLLVEKDFSVYGMAISGSENPNLALILEGEFIKKKINLIHKLMRENLLSDYKFAAKKLVDKDKNREEIVKSLLKIIEKIEQDYGDRNGNKDIDFTYFKLNKTILTVYINELFEISLDHGKWKIKNDYILYYILLWNVVKNARINFLDRLYIYDKNIFIRIMNLLEALRMLSKNNISSLIVFNTKFNKDQGSLSINLKEADKLLAELPLKKHTSNFNYLELIKAGEKYKSVEDIDMDLFVNLCSVDGAVILDSAFNILSYGEIIDTNLKSINEFGTGTNACKVASENGGLAIKVSEDGDIKVYSDGELILTL